MFDGWTISQELFDWIRANLPDGKTILELGSGNGTIELLKHYEVYSVEHDQYWLDRAVGCNYIYAPIRDYNEYKWYDVSKLTLPEHYDLIIVDGPTGTIGRGGFIENINLFNTDVPIIIDDTQRQAEAFMAGWLVLNLNRFGRSFPGGNKIFTVI